MPLYRGLLGDLRNAGPYRLAPLGSAERDSVNLQVIQFLQDDGRTSFSTIARALDTSEKLISSRVETLRETFALDLTVVGDPRALGYRRGAMLGISVPMQQIGENLLKRIGNVSGTSYLALTSGRYDALVEVFFNQGSELLTMIEEISVKVESDAKVEILPYIDVHYQQSSWRQTFQKSVGEASPVVLNPLQISSIDQKIIGLLSRDGRKSFRSIGIELGISEAQVRQRYKRLHNNGVVKVQGLVHPSTLGYNAVAWVGVKNLSQPVTEFIEYARSIEGVTYVVTCFGRFDVMLEVVARDEHDLLKVVHGEIGRKTGYSGTETFLTLELNYKRVVPYSSPEGEGHGIDIVDR